jgi:hypothetical protein
MPQPSGWNSGNAGTVVGYEAEAARVAPAPTAPLSRGTSAGTTGAKYTIVWRAELISVELLGFRGLHESTINPGGGVKRGSAEMGICHGTKVIVIRFRAMGAPPAGHPLNADARCESLQGQRQTLE